MSYLTKLWQKDFQITKLSIVEETNLNILMYFLNMFIPMVNFKIVIGFETFCVSFVFFCFCSLSRGCTKTSDIYSVTKRLYRVSQK